MRLLLDEDTGARSLLNALRSAGHDIERVVDVEVLGAGVGDEAVFAYAVANHRVLLTYNGADFSAIAEPGQAEHAGVLVIHYGSDGKILPTDTIVRAVDNVAKTYPSTNGLILDVNHHVW